jgi:hypothetical protein
MSVPITAGTVGTAFQNLRILSGPTSSLTVVSSPVEDEAEPTREMSTLMLSPADEHPAKLSDRALPHELREAPGMPLFASAD